MPRQIQGSQTDFSFGEVDVALKRADDHPARKAGLRQMANTRILNSGGVQNRPGRRPIFPIANGCTRIEKITMSAGNNFKLGFGAGRAQIVSNTGAVIVNFTAQGNGAALPWTAVDVNTIVYAIFGMSIYITFGHAMRPQVISWNGVSSWTIADYNELISTGGQKRTPFYRLSPQGITMQPSAITGAITVAFSSGIAVAGMVGTRVRWAGRQILLGTVNNVSNMNATVIEPLPTADTITLSSSKGKFTLGDLVIGLSSGAHGIVTSSASTQYINANGAVPFHVGDAVTGGTSGATGVIAGIDDPFAATFAVSLNTGAFIAGETITGPGGARTTLSVTGTTLIVQYLATQNTAPSFTTETIVGPSGQGVVSGGATAAPQAIAVWDDEIINSFRGYPASVFTDQYRVGFCDFTAVPGGIAWSAINSSFDLYVGPNPTDAMFEIAPGKVQVRYVVPGPESSEFVFCDTKLYYIPISPTNPLRPGSVQFLVVSSDGAAQVQPRISQELILYVNAGGTDVMAILATGAYYRPFNTKNLTELHGHLFTSIKAIAVPTADNPLFSERYAYVLNTDGSLVVGKYTLDNVTTNMPKVGWGPWSGGGAINWIDAWNADVHFTSTYFGTGIYEILDDAQYLDCALAVNAPPAAFTPPVGRGPLWFIPSQTVSLMDQVTRSMGTYQIDALGFIIPQNTGGENLAAVSLMAGQPWTMTVEPFAPDANSGVDMGQRMKSRQFGNDGFAAYVVNSTGFYFASLFSAKQTPTSPPLGTIQQTRRVPMWNMGDDPTLPPLLRETVERWSPPGASFDPRAAIIKDQPGPLLIAEIGMEISI